MRRHRLSPKQADCLTHFAKDRAVFDMGSGEPTHWPVNGPVLYIDFSPYHGVVTLDFESREERQRKLYPLMARHKKPILLLSWPINYPSYTYDVTELFSDIVYIGKNTDGAACGNPRLFHKLLRRDVLHSVGNRAADMIIYGPSHASPVEREMEPDEAAALDEYTIRYWEDAWKGRKSR